jgi:hypothetical protein
LVNEVENYWLRRLAGHGDVLLATPAGVLEVDVLNHVQRSRYELQLLADFFADLVALLAEFRTGQFGIGQLIHDPLTGQVLGQTASACVPEEFTPGSATCCGARIASS